MPNTLAHFGVQGFLGSQFFSRCDPKWILIGCVIPDVPWIVQRLVQRLGVSVDLYDLRLYAICQATFLGCLLLSAALALFAEYPTPVFWMLAGNSLAHLLLDATQRKWANGVHLIAPFSWELWNVGWYWPESVVTYSMTLAGLLFVWRKWPQLIARPLITRRPSVQKGCAGMVCLLAYACLPFFLMNGAEQADNHFVKTLREVRNRVGKPVEFDRVPYFHHQSVNMIQTMAREHLNVVGNPLSHSALVSAKARFVSQDSIKVVDLHIHSPWFRDVASIVGLGVLGFVCIVPLMKGRRSEG